MLYDGKEIIITHHAIRRIRERVDPCATRHMIREWVRNGIHIIKHGDIDIIVYIKWRFILKVLEDRVILITVHTKTNFHET